MKYYLNKNEQKNGDHEVHIPSCSVLPETQNGIYLGNFDNCSSAIIEAKKYYPQSNGCFYCLKSCHTS